MISSSLLVKIETSNGVADAPATEGQMVEYLPPWPPVLWVNRYNEVGAAAGSRAYIDFLEVGEALGHEGEAYEKLRALVDAAQPVGKPGEVVAP